MIKHTIQRNNLYPCANAMCNDVPDCALARVGFEFIIHRWTVSKARDVSTTFGVAVYTIIYSDPQEGQLSP